MVRGVRSYGQYCAVARSLDVVGDRWALLIVRELLLRGSCRYTDLRDGLPGIATNLLAGRLRDLEDAGVVRRIDAPPPVATTLYELTARGSELAPVLHALGSWGAELMARPQGSDVFLGHWLAFPISRLRDNAPDSPPITIQIHTGDQPVIVETVDGSVRARPGTADHPDAVVSGAPDALIALLRGQLDIAEANEHELRLEGRPAALQRLQPTPSTQP
jgi:DNA-binding HxlR family transcriptional regulator